MSDSGLEDDKRGEAVARRFRVPGAAAHIESAALQCSTRMSLVRERTDERRHSECPELRHPSILAGSLHLLIIKKQPLQLTYHLALAIGNIASPIACFLPMWIQPRSMPVLVGLTGFTTVVCGAIIALALQSPYPVLHESIWGAVISVSLEVADVRSEFGFRLLCPSVRPE